MIEQAYNQLKVGATTQINEIISIPINAIRVLTR